MKKSEVYFNEDGTAYAVLVSAGWGAGWSTWNDDAVAYDRRVVELWLDWCKTVHRKSYRIGEPPNDVIVNAMKSFGYDYVYYGGWYDIRLMWVSNDDYWRINEYDGSESLEILDKSNGWNHLNEE